MILQGNGVESEKNDLYVCRMKPIIIRIKILS